MPTKSITISVLMGHCSYYKNIVEFYQNITQNIKRCIINVMVRKEMNEIEGKIMSGKNKNSQVRHQFPVVSNCIKHSKHQPGIHTQKVSLAVSQKF